MRQLSFQLEVWIEVKDGNDTARDIFDGHYSRYFYADGRKPKLFVGPGEKMVLVNPEANALFVWRRFISGAGQEGVNCAVFHNSSGRLSSELILEAERLAWQRWPGERLYTYVNPRKVRSSNPGCCFKKAGWRRCGITKHRKLLIFEKCALRDFENGAAGRAEDTGSPGTPPFRPRRSVAPQGFTAGCRGSSLAPTGLRSSPEEWADVVEFDKAIRDCGGMRGKVYLHRSCKPLDEIDFSTAEERGQMNWINECLGMCGV